MIHQDVKKTGLFRLRKEACPHLHISLKMLATYLRPLRPPERPDDPRLLPPNEELPRE